LRARPVDGMDVREIDRMQSSLMPVQVQVSLIDRGLRFVETSFRKAAPQFLPPGPAGTTPEKRTRVRRQGGSERGVPDRRSPLSLTRGLTMGTRSMPCAKTVRASRRILPLRLDAVEQRLPGALGRHSKAFPRAVRRAVRRAITRAVGRAVMIARPRLARIPRWEAMLGRASTGQTRYGARACTRTIRWSIYPASGEERGFSST